MFSGLRADACHCGGAEDRGPVRVSVLLFRVLVEAGVTPAVHLHTPAPLASPHRNPEVPGWHVSVVPGATEVAVRAVLDCWLHWEWNAARPDGSHQSSGELG